MEEEKKSKKLYRSRKDRIIAGVCGGLAEYFSFDVIVVRIIFVILLFFNGLGLILYLIFMVIAPLKPGEDVAVNREEKIEELVRGVRDKAKSLVNEIRKKKK